MQTALISFHNTQNGTRTLGYLERFQTIREVSKARFIEGVEILTSGTSDWHVIQTRECLSTFEVRSSRKEKDAAWKNFSGNVDEAPILQGTAPYATFATPACKLY